jgi:hypothetical protein
VSYFGAVEHEVAPEPSAYRLAELRRADGDGELSIRVLDQNGNPLAGIPVSFRRRDGTGGRSRETGSDGIARFGLDDDAKYAVPGPGPYLARVKGMAGASDTVVGLGQVEGTLGHLDITFQFEPGQAAPSPAPSPPIKVDERWQQVFQRLDALIAILEERIG